MLILLLVLTNIFFFELLLKVFDVVRQLRPSTMQHELASQNKCGNGKVLESAVFEIRKP